MIAALALSAALENAANSLVRRHDAPSVAVAVVNRGRLVYSHVAGNADLHTVYAIGSVTKMFTAVNIFQLVDAGKIALDDPVAKYLPSFPHGADITIRQLLDHRSGIPNYGDIAVRDGLVYRPTTPAQLVARFAAQPLDFAPGTKWSYSNSGYVLLGQIVEHVSGMTLAAYEQKYIFAPAGMMQTAMGRVPHGTRLAEPYVVSAQVFLKIAPADLSWYYACGDIVSNATDLARFDIALLGHRLISASSLALMESVVSTSTLAKGYDDGLGMFAHVVGKQTVVGHHGGEPGYTADNEMVPKDGFAAVILDNGFASTDGVLAGLMAPFYPETAPTLSSDEHQAITLFTAFFTQMRGATIDPATLTDEMKVALTPDAQRSLASQIQPWGALQSVTFVEKQHIGGFMAYHLEVKCSNAVHQVNLSIKDGTTLIGGFQYT